MAGTYSLVDDNYDFALEIKKVSAYSVVTQRGPQTSKQKADGLRLWARGGLIGRYYRTPGGDRWCLKSALRLPKLGVSLDGSTPSGPGALRIHSSPLVCSSFQPHGLTLRWILHWTSCGRRALWRRAQRTISRCTGMATCCAVANRAVSFYLSPKVGERVLMGLR